ncbi:hypothetical protein JW887_06235 [Candidatus Dojkabacteria bacterium]|nr:hypothetical protein [Candidatus Dojkabacteria bacterium]
MSDGAILPVLDARPNELAIPHAQIHELFELAKGNFEQGSLSDFLNTSDEDANEGVTLPKNMMNLTLGIPLPQGTGPWQIVYFDNRSDKTYYGATSGKYVGISNISAIGATNRPIAHIQYSQETGGQLDEYRVTVEQRVNSASFKAMSSQDAGKVETPYGKAKTVSLLDTDENLTQLQFEAERLDEVGITIDGEDKVVRWNRTLHQSEAETTYTDYYLVKDGSLYRSQRAALKFTIDPQGNITIEVGSGPETITTLKKLNIIIHRGSEKMVSILSSFDPRLNFLSNPDAHRDELLPGIENLINERISMLQLHWNQPASVIEASKQLVQE